MELMEMAVLDVEVLEFLKDQAVMAAGGKGKVEFFPLAPYGDSMSIAMIGPDGKSEIKSIPAPPRNYVLQGVEEVIPMCKHLASVLQAKPVLWINRQKIVVTLHDNNETGSRWADQVSLALDQTDQAKKIAVGLQRMEQKEFLRVLRRDLWKALGELGSTLIPALKSISFKNGVAGKSVVGQGRESMGREIEQEVLSDRGDIPETIELTISIYKDPVLDFPQKILCDLEVDAAQQVFSLVPLSGEFDQAMAKTQAQLKGILSADEFPVFLGSPS